MERIILAFLCCCGFCSSLFAREEEIGRGLPIFVIRDRGMAAAFDDLIDQTKAVDRTDTIFGVSFLLHDIDSKNIVIVYVYMYLVQPPEPQFLGLL